MSKSNSRNPSTNKENDKMVRYVEWPMVNIMQILGIVSRPHKEVRTGKLINEAL